MSEQTPNLGLYKPAEGNTDWEAEINANWDTLDSAVGKDTRYPDGLIDVTPVRERFKMWEYTIPTTLSSSTG